MYNTGACDYAGEEHSSCTHVSLEQPAPIDDVPDVNAQPSNRATSQSSRVAMYSPEWGLCVSKRPKNKKTDFTRENNTIRATYDT